MLTRLVAEQKNCFYELHIQQITLIMNYRNRIITVVDYNTKKVDKILSLQGKCLFSIDLGLVGRNFILSIPCKLWTQKVHLGDSKCTKIQHEINIFNAKEVPEKKLIVFSYLSDIISSGGRCSEMIVAKIRTCGKISKN